MYIPIFVYGKHGLHAPQLSPLATRSIEIATPRVIVHLAFRSADTITTDGVHFPYGSTNDQGER